MTNTQKRRFVWVLSPYRASTSHDPLTCTSLPKFMFTKYHPVLLLSLIMFSFYVKCKNTAVQYYLMHHVHVYKYMNVRS